MADTPATTDFPGATYDLDLYSDYDGPAAIGRGVRLVGGRIGWSVHDQAADVLLATIDYIRQYPASRVNDIYPGAGRTLFLNGCQICFKNGRSVTVVDSARSSWNVSGAQSDLLRAFVAELHRRLSLEARATIRFYVGYSERGSRNARIFLALIGSLLVVLPAIGFLMTGEFRPLLLALFGGAMLWRFYKSAAAKTERPYDPAYPDQRI
jgi:hypothetical protein